MYMHTHICHARNCPYRRRGTHATPVWLFDMTFITCIHNFITHATPVWGFYITFITPVRGLYGDLTCNKVSPTINSGNLDVQNT